MIVEITNIDFEMGVGLIITGVLMFIWVLMENDLPLTWFERLQGALVITTVLFFTWGLDYHSDSCRPVTFRVLSEYVQWTS